MSQLEWALRYVSWGWAVLPLHSMRNGVCSCNAGIACKKKPGKHPRTRNGYKDASKDPAQIERWWRANPDANVGVATAASGLVVVDVDGPEGLAQLQAVSAGDIPPTLTATTGRAGGMHLYYLGTDVQSSQLEGEHLDVRGTSGYVLAPGSIHPNGTPYAFVDMLQVPVPRPGWLPGFAANRKGRGKKATRPKLIIPGPAPSATGGRRRLADRAAAGMSEPEPFSWSEARRLMSALAAIPANISGDTWSGYAAACHDLKWIVNGVDVGLEIFDAWSKTSPGKGQGNHEYEGREGIERRWAGFDRPYNGDRCTVASIYAHAKALGWVYQETPAQPVFVNGANGVHTLPATLYQPKDAIVFPDTDKFGKPKATCANARAALRRLGVSCAYDRFHDCMHVAGEPVGQWSGDLTDNAVHMLRVVIQQQYRFDPGSQGVFDATVQECLQHAYDPVQDYLDSLQWDGVPRLRTWMRDYLGADDTALTREIAGLSLMAAVRRAREPGTKFDQLIVLEGPEGVGKSSAIQILAGAENFSDQTIFGVDDRAQQEAVRGVWLYEIADLAHHRRADADAMKAFLSRTTDRARPAYGRSRVDRPRRCVFFGTTNSEQYLISQTGNRRYWPVRCGAVRLDELARVRDQIWAEATYQEENLTSLVLAPALWADATRLQEERKEHEPWNEILCTIERIHLKEKTQPTPDGRGMEYRITSREVMDMVLRVPTEKQTSVTAKRIAYAMRGLGWDGPKVMRVGDQLMRGFTKWKESL